PGRVRVSVTTHADEPKQYVVAHVREALAAHANLNELNVDVSVASAKLFLTGVVGTEERRRALERVVTEVAAGSSASPSERTRHSRASWPIRRRTCELRSCTMRPSRARCSASASSSTPSSAATSSAKPSIGPAPTSSCTVTPTAAPRRLPPGGIHARNVAQPVTGHAYKVYCLRPQGASAGPTESAAEPAPFGSR